MDPLMNALRAQQAQPQMMIGVDQSVSNAINNKSLVAISAGIYERLIGDNDGRNSKRELAREAAEETLMLLEEFDGVAVKWEESRAAAAQKA